MWTRINPAPASLNDIIVWVVLGIDDKLSGFDLPRWSGRCQGGFCLGNGFFWDGRLFHLFSKIFRYLVYQTVGDDAVFFPSLVSFFLLQFYRWTRKSRRGPESVLRRSLLANPRIVRLARGWCLLGWHRRRKDIGRR